MRNDAEKGEGFQPEDETRNAIHKREKRRGCFRSTIEIVEIRVVSETE